MLTRWQERKMIRRQAHRALQVAAKDRRRGLRRGVHGRAGKARAPAGRVENHQAGHGHQECRGPVRGRAAGAGADGPSEYRPGAGRGATETGRPYFVMELVRGVKITDYCDQNELATRDRLELFIQVCQAIQHAHQKGVIHRDIKPSNILVTIIDGLPVPKVIDFGIAKAIEGRLTDNTIFTAYEQFIGTPAYMSPEQAVMSGVDVDTRSDIYSLGVLLYELLTGRTPFGTNELLECGLDGLRRTLQEREPQRPSAIVTTLQGVGVDKVARNRHAEPLKLISLLRGDLDWIVIRALEKDRARRYETANGLAMDVQRILDNEPVVACPPSRVYRLKKLVRRNKATFIAGAMVAATLIVGLGVSTWFWHQERETRKRAVVAEHQALAAEQQQASLRMEAEDRERITKPPFRSARAGSKKRINWWTRSRTEAFLGGRIGAAQARVNGTR